MTKPFTGARTYFIAVLWALFVPSQALLGGLLGPDRGGLLGTGLLAGGGRSSDGKGGLLSTVGGDGKGGLLGAVTGAGEGLLSAVGGDGKGGLLSAVTGVGEGLLSPVGGGGKGGVLDAVGGAGDGGVLGALGGGGKGGVLDAVGGAGNSGMLGALGGGGKGGFLDAVGGAGTSGVLGALGGGGKGGFLDAVGGAGNGGMLGALGGGEGGGLLGSTTGSLLGGGEGGSPLSGILGGKDLFGGDLLGNNLLGGLTGLGSGASQQPHNWFDTLNLRMIRGSWKILRGTELVLNFQATVSFNLPGISSLLNDLSLEINTTAHLAITQDKPGDLKLILRNCPDLVAGYSVKMPNNLILNLLNGFINSVIQAILPPMMCPVFQIWLSIVNLNLRFLNDYYSWGLLGRIHSVMSRMPYSTGQFSELDLKETPFPSVFVNWLLNFARFADSRKAQ